MVQQCYLHHVWDFHVLLLSLSASHACSHSGHEETCNCLQCMHTVLNQKYLKYL